MDWNSNLTNSGAIKYSNIILISIVTKYKQPGVQKINQKPDNLDGFLTTFIRMVKINTDVSVNKSNSWDIKLKTFVTKNPRLLFISVVIKEINALMMKMKAARDANDDAIM